MSNNVTFVTVLRKGGDFDPHHVQWLAKQVPGLVCLSDVPVPGVKTIPLQTDWPGWWAKMEAFGPAIEGDMLLMDLDTVVLRMPDLPKVTTVLTDFTRPHLIGSGFMYVTAEDRARIWQEFTRDPKLHMEANRRAGDQGFLGPLLKDAARWGENICSFKVHCRGGVPDGTDVVCFHGKPRPWRCSASWIPPLPHNDFRDLILTHKGKRFCVMGGAPSLKNDLEMIEADVYVSANGRGAEFREPDYVVAMDEIHQTNRRPMGEHIRSLCKSVIISPHAYADVRLSQWPQQPRWVLSGMIATWASFLMGARVVYLAGFDAHGGDKGYLNEARKIALDVHCPVRVVSGPLTEVWPQYDPNERFTGRYQPHSSIDGWLNKDGIITVRARKTCHVGHREVPAGEVLTVYRHEVRRLLKHRVLEEV